MAEFVVGGFSVEMPVEVYGIEGQRLQILRIDVDYNAEDMIELRAALQRGNVLRLPAQQGFQGRRLPAARKRPCDCAAGGRMPGLLGLCIARWVSAWP